MAAAWDEARAGQSPSGQPPSGIEGMTQEVAALRAEVAAAAATGRAAAAEDFGRAAASSSGGPPPPSREDFEALRAEVAAIRAA